MYNSDHNGRCPPTSPRISFSNDFVETQLQRQERLSKPAIPPSTDFEFSVTNYSMISADELFCKGRMLPYRDNGGNSGALRTIRDELLVGFEEDKMSNRLPKSFSKLKGLLGLRKDHASSKKHDNGSYSNEEISTSKTLQDNFT